MNAESPRPPEIPVITESVHVPKLIPEAGEPGSKGFVAGNIDEIWGMMSDEKLREAMAAPRFDSWLNRVLNSSLHRLSLAVLLARIPIESLPAVGERVEPVKTDIEIDIALGNRSWSLCDEAEAIFDSAVNSGAYLSVKDGGEPLLMVKFTGRRTAICLRSFTVANGTTFLKGNFYSPVDGPTYFGLRDAFDNNEAELPLQSGKWALMRHSWGLDVEGLAAEARAPRQSSFRPTTDRRSFRLNHEQNYREPGIIQSLP